MKVLFDTSVLVPAVIARHPFHTRSFPWLERAHRREFEFVVAAHTLAELYAVLTSLPVKPRLSPDIAAELIRVNVRDHAKVISLSAGDYVEVLERVSKLGLAGGVVYDALVVAAAMKSGADQLLTLNPGDFQRCWPDEVSRIVSP